MLKTLLSIRMKINSLYSLIKEQYNKKNYPLKICTDWDECLMPREAFSHWLFYKREVDDKITFEDFFKKFWSGAKVVYKGHRSEIIDSGIPEIEEIRKKDPEKCLNEIKEFARNDVDFYNRAPFLSFSEELLEAIKQGYVREVIFTTNWQKTPTKLGIVSNDPNKKGDPRKRIVFDRTFKKLPQCELQINAPQEKDAEGKFIEISRADWIKECHSDFDIFIDDNTNTLKKLHSYFPDKIYVYPNYNAIQEVISNGYSLPIIISKLRKEDFVCQEKDRVCEQQAQVIQIDSGKI